MSNTDNFLDAIKAQTDELHHKAHHLAYFKALFKEALPLESYRGQLHALAIILGALERKLEIFSEEEFKTLLNGYVKKLPLLLNDLHYIAPQASQEIVPALRHALEIADDIMLHSEKDPIALLGYLYTLEGSLLGGNVVLPHLKKNFNLESDRGCSYFLAYEESMPSHWEQFKSNLAKMAIDSGKSDLIITASNATFEGLIKIYDALYPFEASKMGYHSAAMNPEAGEHAIPSDPLEIGAAIEASRLCWYEFPYFELRYGERGYRFGISDTAWLVTLNTLDKAALEQQLVWFAKILANRGMPSLILESQLRFLFEALNNNQSIDKSHYKNILDGATYLHLRREAIFPQNEIDTLVASFKTSCHYNEFRKLKNIDNLIISAVIDEHLGCQTAVSSLKTWLSDEKLFSHQWIEDVAADFSNTQKALMTYLKSH